MRKLTRIVAVLALAGCAGERPSDRQAEVAAKGAEVMPFDLDKTHHRFEDRADGGLQTVTVLAAEDSLNVRLIREHLSTEAARFAKGEFDDPMAIHGHEMPGIAELRAAGARLSVEYAEVPGGGRIQFVSGDAAIVAAIHRWFEAQRSDHGKHAS